jgi:predicted hydrocarbon binding protein
MEDQSEPRVQNIVVNALLESFYDILDRDGKNSILRAAGTPELMDTQLDPRGWTDYAVFAKIIDAMNLLLQFSEYIAYEIGRKFAIYSDPSGNGIHAIVENLRAWVQTGWTIEIVDENPASQEMTIKVEDCPFCGSCKEAGSCGAVTCDFLRGIFSMSWEKTSRQAVACIEHDHVFTLKMDRSGEINNG